LAAAVPLAQRAQLQQEGVEVWAIALLLPGVLLHWEVEQAGCYCPLAAVQRVHCSVVYARRSLLGGMMPHPELQLLSAAHLREEED
jgi:hypothetical protein